jgi:hypothetical protein
MRGRLLGVDITSAGVQVQTLLSWLLPMVMAYLTLVLEDAGNRQVNAVLGGGGALAWVATVVPVQGGVTPAGVVVWVWGLAAPLAILWHAWKWPRPEEFGGRAARGDRRPR